jgi:thiamine phosphate synthase YjbQ (UPF0047 family)
MSFQNQISLNTKGHGDMQDITEQVDAVVKSSSIKTGIANVFNIGSAFQVAIMISLYTIFVYFCVHDN